MKIGIISVGPGNIMNLYRGVKKASEKYDGISIDLVEAPTGFYDLLFIPGVGHFREGMKRLKESDLINFIRQHVESGKYIVGVCLGMQLLFEKSEEAPEIDGLSLIKGSVVKLSSKRLPHMGWNEVLFKDRSFPSGYYYFVHTYRVVCGEEYVLGTTEYDGEIFPSAVRKNKILGFQFHPEKSSKIGRKLLERVIECSLFQQ
ncbi:imidazole glycerol phosphate synthase subunit HisH [Thermotoga sp. KOL6]|uniref:imidazole glycerol phosphate synthase subunit HisH n=1 Tax=Thermotoga sp. KOL6 TaxID=126741 RepID=UPI000C7888DA|nr:imidazole glycerol phosphate synthase subunit HisH [Thermotoga sp. KOL6]PLV59790.1 imidazole glycerol phosphate synthase subunit HisH [Thermotoga sp. KOL6]